MMRAQGCYCFSQTYEKTSVGRCRASAKAMAPRRPENHMMHCIFRVILTEDVQLSQPASGKMLSSRPKRHMTSLGNDGVHVTREGAIKKRSKTKNGATQGKEKRKSSSKRRAVNLFAPEQTAPERRAKSTFPTHVRCSDERWVEKVVKAEDGHAQVEKDDRLAHKGNGTERLFCRHWEGWLRHSEQRVGKSKRGKRSTSTGITRPHPGSTGRGCSACSVRGSCHQRGWP